MKRRLCPSCPSFERSGIQCHCSPMSLLAALSSHSLATYLPRCLRSRVTCDKTPNIVTRSEHLKICCHVIITRQTTTAKQPARKFGNLPLQAVV